MNIHRLSTRGWAKAVGIGLAVAILTGALMFAALRTGLSPLPKPSAWHHANANHNLGGDAPALRIFSLGAVQGYL